MPTQPTATDIQPTGAKFQSTGTSPQPTAAKSQQTADDTKGVNPNPIEGNLQQIGDNSQQAGDNLHHKDLSETKSEDIEEEGQITMKHNNSSPKENTTYRREASFHHGQENRVECWLNVSEGADQQVEEPVYKDSQSTKGQTFNNKRAFPEANPTYIRNRQPGIPEKTKAGQPVRNDKKERTYGIPKQTGSRSKYSDDEQYDMTEANRIEKSRSRTDMNDWTNQLWIPIINVIVTVIVCVLFMKVYPRWGQVQPVSTIDNSRTTKELMTMGEAIRDLRNENKKYKTMLDDMSSKLMTLDKANIRVDNLNEKFGELEKSFKTMTESNTGMLEEIRRKIDNNSDKLRENTERIKQVNTDISNTRIDLDEKIRRQDFVVRKTIQESNKEVRNFLRELEGQMELTAELMQNDIAAKMTNLEEKLYQQIHDVKQDVSESNVLDTENRREVNQKIKQLHAVISNAAETVKKAESAKEMLELQKEVELLKANAFNKSVMLNLFVFLTMAVFALAFAIQRLWCRMSPDRHGSPIIHLE